MLKNKNLKLQSINSLVSLFLAQLQRRYAI